MTFLVFLALHLVNLLIVILVILVSQLNIYFVVVHVSYYEVESSIYKLKLKYLKKCYFYVQEFYEIVKICKNVKK